MAAVQAAADLPPAICWNSARITHNIPRVVARGRVLHVNGAYRHGYLLAPVLARAAADLVLEGRRREGIVVDG